MFLCHLRQKANMASRKLLKINEFKLQIFNCLVLTFVFSWPGCWAGGSWRKGRILSSWQAVETPVNFAARFIYINFVVEENTPFDVGLYKTKHCIQDNPINPLVSFTKTFLCLSMKNPRCIFQETIHQDSYNLILQLYVP